MKREEVLDRFFIEHLEIGIEAQKRIKDYYRKNKISMGKEIENAFIHLAGQIKDAQQRGTKEEIAYIELCFLRSNFYFKNGNVRIFAFDQRFLLDTEPLWVDVDFTVLCEHLWELEEKLCHTLKQYKNKIYRSDVHLLIETEYIQTVISVITAVAKSVVYGEVIGRCIRDISITDDFSILSGEYQGDFEEIFITETVDAKGLSLKEYLKIHKKDPNIFCSKQYMDQRVNHLDLRGINFANSRFLRMDLTGTILSDSVMINTEWKNCTLINTDWKEAMLFGASFTDSNLSESDFSEIIAPVVPANICFKRFTALEGLCFHGSVLESVKFIGADLRGADFSGAQFYHTDFSDAFLVGAKFDKDILEKIDLSPEQISQIKL